MEPVRRTLCLHTRSRIFLSGSAIISVSYRPWLVKDNRRNITPSV